MLNKASFFSVNIPLFECCTAKTAPIFFSIYKSNILVSKIRLYPPDAKEIHAVYYIVYLPYMYHLGLSFGINS